MKKSVLFLFALAVSLQYLIAQGTTQDIGEVPGISGGFEDMSATPVSDNTAFTSGKTYWTRWDLDAYIYNSTGGRSGPKYMTLGESSSTSRLRSSTTGSDHIASNTQYVYQFYYKNTGNTNNLQVYLQPDGSTTLGTGTNITAGNTSGAWTKATGTVTSKTATPGDYGHFVFRFSGASANNISIDDVCIYQGSQADETAPDAPTDAVVDMETPFSLFVQWAAPAGGVDGGGYMVVRGTTDPQTAPNANGIYATGNTIGSGTVVYIGASTGFTDNGLSANTAYYYRVYALDKAFNYSGAVAANGATKALTTDDYRFNTGSGEWTVSSNWLKYNGSSWVTAVSYPGASTANVYITGGRTVYLDGNPSCNNLVISGGALLYDNNTTRSLTVYGDLENSGTLRPVAAENTYGQSTIKTHTLTVKGNLVNYGTIKTATDRDGTDTYYKCMRIHLKMEGGGNASLTNKGTFDLRYSLTVNKTNVSDLVTLGSDITMADFTLTDNPPEPQLILTSGKIITTGSSLLNLAHSASVTGGSPASFVSGPVKKTGDDAFTFPVGKGSNYQPLSITAPQNTSDAYTAEYFNTGQSLGNDTVLTITNLSACEYWMLNKVAGSSVVALTIGWNTNSCNKTTAEIMRIAAWDGNLWQNVGAGNITGNSDSGSVTSQYINDSFNTFTLANASRLLYFPDFHCSYNTSCSQNLVQNGEFDDGYSNFLSDYQYINNSNFILPYTWHDHIYIITNASTYMQNWVGISPGGTGNFLMCDAWNNTAGEHRRIWFQSISNLVIGTTYYYSFNIRSLDPTSFSGSSEPGFEVGINGDLLPLHFTLNSIEAPPDQWCGLPESDDPYKWVTVCGSWQADATDITFEIRDDVHNNVYGQDMGIDKIFFAKKEPTLDPFNPICENAGTIVLSGGYPSGGYYTGDGVQGGITFDPGVAGAGPHDITYHYTNQNNCTNTATQTIIVKPVPDISLVSITNPLCYGDANGAIDISVSNGTAPYTYMWSDNATTQDLVNLPTGQYTVTVTDDFGCVTSETYNVTQPALLSIASVTVTDNTCSCIGSVQVTVTGGYLGETGYYGYTWSTGSHNPGIISGLCADNYSVTVGDDNGCTVSQNFVVNDNIQCCTGCDYNLGTNPNWVGYSSAIFGTGNITVSNQTICLYGTLHINNTNITFTGCTFNMGEHARIEIDYQYATTLTIDGTTIQACHDKWDWISVPAPSCTLNVVNGSLIEDAHTAVNATGSSVTGGGVINIDGSTASNNFSNNDISIYIHDWNYTGSGMITNPAVITHNHFSDAGMNNIGISIENLIQNNIVIGSSNTFNQLETGILAEEAPKIVLNSGNEFYNCNFGVHYQNLTQSAGWLDVASCWLQGIQSVGVWCNTMRHVNITGSSFYSITNNGIELTDCETIDINSNQFNGIAKGWAITHSGVNFPGYLVINVSGNTITDARNGIRFLNIFPNNPNDPYGVISANTISLDNPQQPQSGRYRGIDIEGCSNINVNGANSVTGQSTNNWINGIEVENSEFINVECNIVQTVGQGIWFGGSTPSVYIWGNQMSYCNDGVFFNYNSLTGDQGSLSQPSDNQWLSNFARSNTYAFWTAAAAYTFFVRDDPPNYVYYPQVNLYEDPTTPPSTALTINANATGSYFNCGSQFRLQGGSSHNTVTSTESDSLQYKLEKEIAKNEIVFIVNEEEYRWAGKNYLYGRLMNEPAMLQADSVFGYSKDSLMNTNIGTIYNYKTLSADTTVADSVKIAQLTVMNNSITPVNITEENLKTINSLNLKIKETGFNSLDTVDKQTLVSIANQCPYTGSKAVYAARVLCSLLGYPDEYDGCNSLQNNMKINQNSFLNNIDNNTDLTRNIKLAIYPNPSDGKVSIDYDLKSFGNGTLEFFDIWGIKVRTMLLNGTDTKSISIDLPAGLYNYKLVVNEEFVTTGRLIIIK